MKGKSWKWFEQMAVGQEDNTKKEETRWAGRMESGKKN